MVILYCRLAKIGIALSSVLIVLLNPACSTTRINTDNSHPPVVVQGSFDPTVVVETTLEIDRITTTSWPLDFYIALLPGGECIVCWEREFSTSKRELCLRTVSNSKRNTLSNIFSIEDKGIKEDWPYSSLVTDSTSKRPFLVRFQKQLSPAFVLEVDWSSCQIASIGKNGLSAFSTINFMKITRSKYDEIEKVLSYNDKDKHFLVIGSQSETWFSLAEISGGHIHRFGTSYFVQQLDPTKSKRKCYLKPRKHLNRERGVFEIGPDGSVHAVWFDDRERRAYYSLYYAKYTEKGWSKTRLIDNKTIRGRVDYGCTQIAVAPDGSVDIIWTRKERIHDPSPIYYRRINPNGILSTPIELPKPERTRWRRGVWVGSDSIATHIIYGDGDLYYRCRWKEDGSWSVPRRLTTVSDPSVGSFKACLDRQHNVIHIAYWGGRGKSSSIKYFRLKLLPRKIGQTK